MKKLSPKVKKVVGVVLACMFVLTCSVCCFAAETSVSTDLSSFNSSITGGLADFTTGNLATILLAALGITVGLVICWFAYRWIVRKLSGALKKGRL